jgi:hypothetical protein
MGGAAAAVVTATAALSIFFIFEFFAHDKDNDRCHYQQQNYGCKIFRDPCSHNKLPPFAIKLFSACFFGKQKRRAPERHSISLTISAFFTS